MWELWRISYDVPVHGLYLLQAAVWISTCFSHVCLEERRRDYILMLAHHVVTIGLVWLSYTFNFVAVGVVTMFIHDASDVFIDLMKLSNYLQLEGLRGFFIVETCYVANLVSWAYVRLYMLPVHVIWRTIVVASREIATAPGAPGMESFTKASGGNAYGRGHAPGFLVCRGSCGKPMACGLCHRHSCPLRLLACSLAALLYTPRRALRKLSNREPHHNCQEPALTAGPAWVCHRCRGTSAAGSSICSPTFKRCQLTKRSRCTGRPSP